MTDKTIYWNGATGKRGPDEPTTKEVIAEIIDGMARIVAAQDYMRRQIEVLQAQVKRLQGDV